MIAIGLANGANQYFIAIIATLITILILYFRKLYNDKKDKNAVNESSTNILQIELIGNKPNSEEIINQLKKNLNYLNLKSLSSDNQIKQFNFLLKIGSVFHG